MPVARINAATTFRRTFPALSALCLVVSMSTPAFAFCRSRVCDTQKDYPDVWQEPPDPPCKRDEQTCRVEGLPLYWPQTCVSFAVQKHGSPLRGVSYEYAHASVVRAFETWLRAGCATGKPSFAVLDRGSAECRVADFNEDGRPNANVVIFRDDVIEELDEFTIALTTTSYHPETGEIFDADIEINSARYDFSPNGPSPNAAPNSGWANLDAVMAHEVGHFLGLSHSAHGGATMARTYDSRASQSTLHPDDIEGICTVYPPGRKVDTTNCEPFNGFSTECEPPEPDSGCALGATGSGAGGGLLVVAASALAALLRRRRR